MGCKLTKPFQIQHIVKIIQTIEVPDTCKHMKDHFFPDPNVDTIDRLHEINMDCYESDPCEHDIVLLTKDGKKESMCTDSIHIAQLIKKYGPPDGMDIEMLNSHFDERNNSDDYSLFD
ncbi:MAG: hypothetical protein Sylvanvirus18_16 [Sylvanvirus sp.]|uniref:Uncharacterized protein n=1 Tax=Sylvanvirus sp. TaxID=2487774 RepID=A0A3G5AL15_9VIRU|nr:MAG: hypothetical protein Sylvanvirus18_16 [Sylvanvirus sp.]